LFTLAMDDRRAITVVGAIQSRDVIGLRQQLDEHPGLAQARIVDGKGVARTLLHVIADWRDIFQTAHRRWPH